jgi:valyl-tRNA synthetase
MRFTLIRGAPLGTDLQLNNEDLEAAFRPGRNFANKIWNAARFALPHLPVLHEETAGPALADRWIRSRLARSVTEVDASFETFRLHEAAEACQTFVWGDFCDWYLELVKPRLDAPGTEGYAAAGNTLKQVMEGWLALLHPIMPFVTDEIARRIPGRGEDSTLVMGPWPEIDASWVDEAAESAMDALRELVGAVRALRAEYRVDPRTPVEVRIGGAGPALQAALDEERSSVMRLASLSKITDVGHGSAGAPGEAGAHAVLRTGGELFIPLAGVIDLDRERARIDEETRHVSGLLRATEGKLRNEGFVANAPEEVVQREKDKLLSLADQVERLQAKLRSLGSTG